MTPHTPPSTICPSFEHLAVDEVIVLLKERVILKHYISEEHKCFDQRFRNFAT
jgi:hypothetical protein